MTGPGIRQYVYRHHSAWHRAARKLGYDLQSHEIILVTGFLKTSRWAISTLKRLKQSNTLSLSLRMTPYAILGPTFTLVKPSNGQVSLDQRWGPHHATPLNNEPQSSTHRDLASQNQTLFLQYYKLKRRSIHGKTEFQEADSQLGSSSSKPCTGVPFRCISRLISRIRTMFIPREPQVEEGPYDEVRPSGFEKSVHLII